jgi:hypothetical protein
VPTAGPTTDPIEVFVVFSLGLDSAAMFTDALRQSFISALASSFGVEQAAILVNVMGGDDVHVAPMDMDAMRRRLVGGLVVMTTISAGNVAQAHEIVAIAQSTDFPGLVCTALRDSDFDVTVAVTTADTEDTPTLAPTQAPTEVPETNPDPGRVAEASAVAQAAEVQQQRRQRPRTADDSGVHVRSEPFAVPDDHCVNNRVAAWTEFRDHSLMTGCEGSNKFLHESRGAQCEWISKPVQLTEQHYFKSLKIQFRDWSTDNLERSGERKDFIDVRVRACETEDIDMPDMDAASHGCTEWQGAELVGDYACYTHSDFFVWHYQTEISGALQGLINNDHKWAQVMVVLNNDGDDAYEQQLIDDIELWGSTCDWTGEEAYGSDYYYDDMCSSPDAHEHPHLYYYTDEYHLANTFDPLTGEQMQFLGSALAATAQPTETPTETPTDAPTHSPTKHVCNDGTHGCDLTSTYCAIVLGTHQHTCECLDGFVTHTAHRCTATFAPTEAPTDAPTDAPTKAPTETPTDAPTDTPTDAPPAPAYMKMFDGECSGAELNKFNYYNPNPGTTVAERVQNCADACLNVNIPEDPRQQYPSGGVAKGFMVSPWSGACGCEPQDSSTCVRVGPFAAHNGRGYDRYDFATPVDCVYSETTCTCTPDCGSTCTCTDTITITTPAAHGGQACLSGATRTYTGDACPQDYEFFCNGSSGSNGNYHGQYHMYAPNWGFTSSKVNWGTASPVTADNIPQKCKDWCSSEDRCIGYYADHMWCKPDFKSSADCSAVCEANPSGIVHPHMSRTSFCNQQCVSRMSVQSGYSDSDKPCNGWSGKTFKKTL